MENKQTAEQIAQWVIDNTYPCGVEGNKLSQFEIYHTVKERIELLIEQTKQQDNEKV